MSAAKRDVGRALGGDSALRGRATEQLHAWLASWLSCRNDNSKPAKAPGRAAVSAALRSLSSHSHPTGAADPALPYAPSRPASASASDVCSSGRDNASLADECVEDPTCSYAATHVLKHSASGTRLQTDTDQTAAKAEQVRGITSACKNLEPRSSSCFASRCLDYRCRALMDV